MRLQAFTAATALLLSSGCTVDSADPPEYGLYFPVVVVAQVRGVLDPSSPGEVDLELVRPIVAGPELTPDFQQGAAPPFCLAFSFGSMRPPNLINADAGEIVIEGLEASSFMDLSTGVPGAPTTLPSPMRCRRADVAGTSPYSCPPVTPLVMVPPGEAPWMKGSTRVSISTSGGTQVGALSEEGIAPPAPLAPDFDLTAITRDDVTVSWQPTAAAFVMVEILAQLQDGSEGAQILCLERGDAGQKRIPEGALALIPSPTAQAPLIVQTNAAAVESRTAYAGWGNYLVGVGRGFFGLTCHTPSGPCGPAPAQ